MRGEHEDRLEVSVVIPAKDEAGTIEELTASVIRVLEAVGKTFEIIMIDDGSADGTWAKMKSAAQDPRVRCVRLLKNFGKAAALSAGFERARGRVVITMDADLQDDPLEIPRFLEALDSGAHLVSGWKRDRQDPISKTLPSKIFNLATRLFSGVDIHDMNCGFKAYRREVLQNLSIYGDLHRFIPMLAAARGYTVAEIPVTHHPRRSGRSKYGVARLPRGFFDLLTVAFLTQYNRRPLHLFGGIGAVIGLIGFVFLSYLTILWFTPLHDPIGTRPLFMGGIMLLLLGAQLVGLGLVGELITQQSFRPGDQYVVEEEVGD